MKEKGTNRIISLLMSLCMLFALVPTTAFAAEQNVTHTITANGTGYIRPASFASCTEGTVATDINGKVLDFGYGTKLTYNIHAEADCYHLLGVSYTSSSSGSLYIEIDDNGEREVSVPTASNVTYYRMGNFRFTAGDHTITLRAGDSAESAFVADIYRIDFDSPVVFAWLDIFNTTMTIPATTTNTANALKSYVEEFVTAANNDSNLTMTVSQFEFTAAVAGDADNPDGTEGYYFYDVTVSDGTRSHNPDRMEPILITAIPYEGISNADAVAAAKAAVVDGVVIVSVDAAQTAKTSAAQTYVDGLLSGVANAEGVSAEVTHTQDNDYRVYLEKGARSDEITITVTPVSLTGITVTTQPTKNDYYQGESFDPAGMVVTASYESGMTRVVDNYTVSPGGALTEDNDKVTISYTDCGITKTADVAITVEKRLILEYRLATTQTNYYAGDEITADIYLSHVDGPTMGSYDMRLDYDEEYLTLATLTGVHEDALVNKANGAVFWASTDDDGIVISGEGTKLATAVFTVNTDFAATGDTELGFNNALVGNLSGNTMGRTQDGTIVGKSTSMHMVKQYAVNYSAEANGFISPSGIVNYDAGYTLQASDEPVATCTDAYKFNGWKINDESELRQTLEGYVISSDTDITATFVDNRFSVEYELLHATLTDIAGVEDGLVVKGTEITFKIAADAGYTTTNAMVSYTVGDTNMGKLQPSEGVYTIAAGKATAPVVINVTCSIDAVVSMPSFGVAPAGKQFIKVEGNPGEGKVYAIDGENLYYSEPYGAYVGFASESYTQETIGSAFTIEDGTAIEIVYDGDIDGLGGMHSNDARIVVTYYNGNGSYTLADEGKYLAMDYNKDGKVNVMDVQAMAYTCVGLPVPAIED